MQIFNGLKFLDKSRIVLLIRDVAGKIYRKMVMGQYPLLAFFFKILLSNQGIKGIK